MKYTTHFCLFFSLFTLHACSLNTKFDDGDYRPVGASTPINSETHTVSQTKSIHVDDKINYEIESNSTRYVKPNSQAIENNEGVKKTIVATNTTQSTSGTVLINNNNLTSHSKKSNSNIIDSINDVFSSRYGNSDIIIKISKTVQIHCINGSNKPSKPSAINVCEYQFPKQCGAHRFSVINRNNKQLLMFHDIGYQRNIIDTLNGNTESTPGLWDRDDYVSTDLLTVKQLINDKTSNTNDLGWIMSVSDIEKSQLGRSYLSAIRDASKCF